MSSSKDERRSPEHTLSLPSAIESPQSRPVPLDSEEEDVLFRVARGPHWTSSPSILALPSLLTPSSLDLAGPSNAISMITMMDALHFWGTYRIPETIRFSVLGPNERVTLGETGWQDCLA